MIKIENYEVTGWKHAILGMRNPMNSWDKCDSGEWSNGNIVEIGPNDHDLMMRLASAGPVHGKFRRMITVYVDITAPLYWWKEFDTYKVGTVANSCSTMHKIHAKEFTWDDFSTEHLLYAAKDPFEKIIDALNELRDLYSGYDGFKYKYGDEDKKEYWYNMIQLLPSSYNQKRTVMLNYEVLANIYEYRRNHKLDEWHVFCDWIESLPYSEIIIGEEEKNDSI